MWERAPEGHLVQPASTDIFQEVSKMVGSCFPDDPGKYIKKKKQTRQSLII